ncbi:protein of unknown function [Magnetospirillum gryphiswaldense MSR-1 v2]|uniref:Uncharacterized protein n=1 Tax=Magnetospirillum gryphiswaldense (strain DSM 6361 / JCM 21280 / NBRC 15271 / MSR-1) TaxID=431944 RepID=V6F7F9_MAGGM|nr:protein of unknown function [Magnetospirillum gryphiswaldense MSR-1 v2]
MGQYLLIGLEIGIPALLLWLILRNLRNS